MPLFFNEDYLAAAYAFDTTRKAGPIAESLVTHPIAGVALVEPDPATRADLKRVHDAEYVDAVLTGEPRRLASGAGLGWDRTFVTALLASTGGCIAAAEAAWASGTAGSLSSGLHHAGRARGSGFCTLNGLALAAMTFLDLGAGSVLIVDLDAHCGGGTQDILGANPRVAQLDVSTDSYDHRRPIDGWTSDLISDPDDYLPTITRRFDDIDTETIGAIVFNAGVDPHEDCETGGLRGITDAVLAERDRLVFHWAAVQGVPIAFVLAGGYTGEHLTDDELTALHRVTIAAAAKAHLVRDPTHPGNPSPADGSHTIAFYNPRNGNIRGIWTRNRDGSISPSSENLQSVLDAALRQGSPDAAWRRYSSWSNGYLSSRLRDLPTETNP